MHNTTHSRRDYSPRTKTRPKPQKLLVSQFVWSLWWTFRNILTQLANNISSLRCYYFIKLLLNVENSETFLPFNLIRTHLPLEQKTWTCACRQKAFNFQAVSSSTGKDDVDVDTVPFSKATISTTFPWKGDNLSPRDIFTHPIRSSRQATQLRGRPTSAPNTSLPPREVIYESNLDSFTYFTIHPPRNVLRVPFRPVS